MEAGQIHSQVIFVHAEITYCCLVSCPPHSLDAHPPIVTQPLPRMALQERYLSHLTFFVLFVCLVGLVWFLRGLFFETGFLCVCSSGYPGTHTVDQVSLELTGICLSLPPSAGICLAPYLTVCNWHHWLPPPMATRGQIRKYQYPSHLVSFVPCQYPSLYADGELWVSHGRIKFEPSFPSWPHRSELATGDSEAKAIRKLYFPKRMGCSCTQIPGKN